jgi:3-methyladenine DNA glycosylase AlkD
MRMARRPTPSPLLEQVRDALEREADPKRAPKMQAYMKSAMPYWGVPAPRVRALSKQLFADYAFASFSTWQADVLALWRGATHREERYAAIALTGHRRAKDFQTLESLPIYEELIVTGAWWDYVDELAEHRIGPLLAAYPKPMRKTMLAWSRGDDLWKRRSSIICQMFFGADTDLSLLYTCIEPSLSSKEFFLRKAIGWALRQVAWRDPEEVERYVKAHRAELSPLSQREALKNVARLRSGELKKRSG